MARGYKCDISSKNVILEDVYVVLSDNIDSNRIREEIEIRLRKRFGIYGKLEFQYSEIDLNVIPMNELMATDMLILFGK